MYCPKCDKETDGTFCEFCGTKTLAKKPKEHKKINKKLYIIISVIVIFIIAALVIVTMVIKNHNSDNEKSDTSISESTSSLSSLETEYESSSSEASVSTEAHATTQLYLMDMIGRTVEDVYYNFGNPNEVDWAGQYFSFYLGYDGYMFFSYDYNYVSGSMINNDDLIGAIKISESLTNGYEITPDWSLGMTFDDLSKVIDMTSSSPEIDYSGEGGEYTCKGTYNYNWYTCTLTFEFDGVSTYSKATSVLIWCDELCDGEKEITSANTVSVDYSSYIGNWNASSSNENNDTTMSISNIDGNNVQVNITRVIGQGMYVDDLTISGQIDSNNTLYFNSITSGGWGNICSGYIKFENGIITATVTVTPGEYGSSCDCAMTDEVFTKE